MENKNNQNVVAVKLLTAEEASKIFFNGKKSYGAMICAARKHQLPSLRVGNRIFFEKNSLNAFFIEQLNNSQNGSEKTVDGIACID